MAEEAPKIEIFGDSPTIEDGLGFEDYANILLELIGNFDARSPLTIGIHGRWGSGKTSLMRMLEKRFRDGVGVKTVWFNGRARRMVAVAWNRRDRSPAGRRAEEGR